MDIEKLTAPRKINNRGAPLLFKLKYRFTVCVWDWQVLSHLNSISSEKPDASFVFGRSHQFNQLPSAYYITDVLASVVRFCHNSNPLIAQVAIQLTELCYVDLEAIYEDMVSSVQEIEERVEEERALFDDYQTTLPFFDKVNTRNYTFTIPSKIYTKSAVLIVKILKLVDGAMYNLEQLTLMCVMTQNTYNLKKEQLIKPLRDCFIEIDERAKRFHLKRKQIIENQN